MPTDKFGKFHLNSQRAHAAERRDEGHMATAERSGSSSEEGTPEHHLGRLREAMGGKHMHVHQDEMGGYTSHHVGHDGQIEGPHEHENMEALKDHMDQFFEEEANEGGEPERDWGGRGAPEEHRRMAGI